MSQRGSHPPPAAALSSHQSLSADDALAGPSSRSHPLSPTTTPRRAAGPSTYQIHRSPQLGPSRAPSSRPRRQSASSVTSAWRPRQPAALEQHDHLDLTNSKDDVHATSSPIRRKGKGRGTTATSSNQMLTRTGDYDEEGQVTGDVSSLPRPPSFAESQFETIIRRQRKLRLFSPMLEQVEQGLVPNDGPSYGHKNHESGKSSQKGKETPPVNTPPPEKEEDYDHKGALLKFGRHRGNPNRSGPLNSYEFAGWGNMAMLEISAEEREAARQEVEAKEIKASSLLGQFRAAAVAGNAVTGSIFYALPSVFAVGGVWTPVCLVLAALLMIPVLAVIHGLTSGLKGSTAGSYSYLLNVAGRTLALIAGAVTILDAISTGAVSGATAAAYVSAEANGFSMQGLTVIFLVVLTATCLVGLRDSSTLALSMFTLHILTITALLIASAVAWGKTGNDVLRANWQAALNVAGSAANLGGKTIARSLFDGTVVAFVGLTGFETTVAYSSAVKPGSFAKALRNIWIAVALLEGPIALLTLAILPFESILSANNILALLGASVAGQAMKLIVVIDAAIVLCGGILTGAISCCGVLLAMSDDGTLPEKLAGIIQKTGAPVWCLTAYLVLSIAMCGTSGFSLLTVSSVFSIIFLCVLTLFGLASVLLLYSRPLLPRYRIPLSVMLLSLSITITALAGNIALSPTQLGQTAAYAGVIGGVILLWANRVPLTRIGAVWLPCQSSWLRQVLRTEKKATEWVRNSRRSNQVVFMTSSDELSVLIQALDYVKNHEESVGKVILVHCYSDIDSIPTELESNHQLVDEAFPSITVDLVFIEAPFDAVTIQLLSKRLGVQMSRFFIGCPTTNSKQALASLGGVRIIMD